MLLNVKGDKANDPTYAEVFSPGGERATSIDATKAFDSDGVPIAVLGINTNNFCAYIRIRSEEIELIPRVADARWDDRGSIRIGESALSPAFWCSDAETVSILIGHDDESWGIAITLPLDALRKIYEALSSLREWLATTPHVMIPKRPGGSRE